MRICVATRGRVLKNRQHGFHGAMGRRPCSVDSIVFALAAALRRKTSRKESEAHNR